MKIRATRALRKAEDLKGGMQRWALKIGVEPMRVQVQRMTTKWASCSPSGRICLSRDLLREDVAFQQIVIVHELLHLRVPNHGKLFKSLMKAFLPGWEEEAGGRIGRMCGYQDIVGHRSGDGNGYRVNAP